MGGQLAPEYPILYNREIEKYNSTIEDPTKRKKKINESLANQILFNLQHHSLDEQVQLKLISRRTKYNYLKILERLEIGKNSVLNSDFSLDIVRDFSVYQSQIEMVLLNKLVVDENS